MGVEYKILHCLHFWYSSLRKFFQVLLIQGPNHLGLEAHIDFKHDKFIEICQCKACKLMKDDITEI